MVDVKRMGVVGCGQMGSGIAEILARASLDVVAVDEDERLLERAASRIDASLERALAANKLSAQECEHARSHLRFSVDLHDLADREVVFEAITEREEPKQKLFAALDEIVASPSAVLASNTSSIPIARLASATRRPEWVIGVHFFHPVPVMPLVEITRSILTGDGAVGLVEPLISDILGKSVIKAPDRAGFVVNTLLIPYLLSAIRMLEAGFADAESIDIGMEKGCAHPMGPLRLTDFIGLDTVKFIADALYEEFKDGAFAAPALLLRMVEANLLGKKTGRGFYDYAG